MIFFSECPAIWISPPAACWTVRHPSAMLEKKYLSIFGVSPARKFRQKPRSSNIANFKFGRKPPFHFSCCGKLTDLRHVLHLWDTLRSTSQTKLLSSLAALPGSLCPLPKDYR